jgi:hypothetical protein
MVDDVKKNLIYFIYHNGKLHHYHVLNLKLLSLYWNVFDGQKIVKIAVDGRYSIDALLSLLPKDCEYRIVKNIKETGEAYHFLESLVEIKEGMTFYAHCKGVTRPMWRGLDMWIHHLYKKNLENVPTLGGKIFAGVLGKLLPCPPYVPEAFHYSGSFYWMDTEKVKSRLTKMTYNKYFTERFPAIIAKKEECIFGFGSTNKNLNFYDEKTWVEITK